MNKILRLALSGTLLLLVIFGSSVNMNSDPKSEEYIEFINNHPFAKKSHNSNDYQSLPKQDRPDLAAEQDYLMTIDPQLKVVPRERLFNAFQSTKKRLKNRKLNKSSRQQKAIEDVIWEERGPNNVGGRTRAIMWDPNDSENRKVWAGSVSGGIWVNDDVTDATSSWRPVNDFLSNLAISSFAYDPSNTNVFYAGTGEGYRNFDAGRGAGIFKSDDGGLTWNILSSTQNSDFYFVQRVVVAADGTVFASTRNAGLLRSTDGGSTWTIVLSSTIDNAMQ